MLSSLSVLQKHHEAVTIETKSGIFIYRGDPHHFHEWEFRTMARYNGCDDEDRWKVGYKILEGLKDDAFLVAKDMGLEALNETDSVPRLVENMRKMVFPLQTREAKVLYTQGHKQHGVLSRQVGESMMSYITRRKRWWRLLQELDKSTFISENIRADLMLDLANISDQEKLMIKTSCGNKSDFDLIADALLDHHVGIENRERRRARPEEARPYKGYGSKSTTWRGKGFQKRVAHQSVDDDAYLEQGSDSDVDFAFNAQDDVSMEEESDEPTKDAVEMGVFTAFLANDEFQEADNDSISLLSDVAQTEVAAYYARTRAKGKGKSLPPQFPSKPRNKFGKSRPSGLSLEDRRKKLKEIKSKSTCKKCGKKGHWAGDAECQTKVANYSVVAQPRIACHAYTIMDDESGSDAYMAVKGKTTAQAKKGKEKGKTSQGYPEEPEEYVISEPDEGMTEVSSVNGENEPIPESLDKRFTFGQYIGESYAQITKERPGYVIWACKETTPGPQLAEYISWVNKFFVINIQEKKVTRRTTPVDEGYEIVTMVPPARTRQSKVSQLKPSPEGPCVPQCNDELCSRAGSTVHTIKLTCFKCGHSRTMQRKPAEATIPASVCPHNNTDSRGSNKSVHRTFCTDCMTVVDVCSQDEWKNRKALGSQVTSGTARQVIQHERLHNTRCMTADQARSVVKLYVNMQSPVLDRLAPGTVISSTEMASILSDAIDYVCDAVHDVMTSTAASSEGHAYTASTLEGESREENVQLTRMQLTRQSSLGPTLFPEPPRADLRDVDIMKDNNVWIVLDEGCNSTCHGLAWALNAEKKFYDLGYNAPIVSRKQKSYSGIGATVAIGRRRIPFGLKLLPSNLIVNGTFDSYELKDSKAPLLLSLQAQAHMGLIKNVRDGTCTMADYPGQSIRLARTHDTGLFAMCISDLSKDECHEVLNPLRVGPDPDVDWMYGGISEPTSPDGCAYPAAASEDALPIDKKFLDKDISIMTMGLENFEIGDKSERGSKIVHAWIRNDGNGKSYGIDLDNKDHRKMLITSLRMNYAHVRRYAIDEIILLDCRTLDDAAHTPGLRDHLGMHPENMETISTSRSFQRIWPVMVQQLIDAILTPKTQRVLIVTICKSGRHRSVAVREFLKHCITRSGMTLGALENCSAGKFWDRTCAGHCPKCDWSRTGIITSVILNALNRAWTMWTACSSMERMAPSSGSGNAAVPDDASSTWETINSAHLSEGTGDMSASMRSAPPEEVSTQGTTVGDASAKSVLKEPTLPDTTLPGKKSTTSIYVLAQDKKTPAGVPQSTKAHDEDYSYTSSVETEKKDDVEPPAEKVDQQATPAATEETEVKTEIETKVEIESERTEADSDLDVTVISEVIGGEKRLCIAVLKRLYSVFDPTKDVDSLVEKYPMNTPDLVVRVCNKYRLSHKQCVGVIESVKQTLLSEEVDTPPGLKATGRDTIVTRMQFLENKVLELEKKVAEQVGETTSRGSRPRGGSDADYQSRERATAKHARYGRRDSREREPRRDSREREPRRDSRGRGTRRDSRERDATSRDPRRREEHVRGTRHRGPREHGSPSPRRHDNFHPRYMSEDELNALFERKKYNFM